MGVKPLYYHVSDGSVAFASEVKSILSLPQVPRRLNELAIAIYLEERQPDRERTFYDAIMRVPPAHWLRFRRAASDRQRYWRLDAGNELRLRDDDAYAEAMREVFTRAVSCRLRSAYPVGATLSGGLDSSSIVCVARDLLARAAAPSLHTYSAVFPGLPDAERRVADESEYINAVAATGGLVSRRVECDRLDAFHDFARVLWHVDEVPMGYNLYMHWALYGAARSDGVRVFLDGFDGDVAVGTGRERLAELLSGADWAGFESEVRALGARLSHDPMKVAREYVEPWLDILASRGRWVSWVRAVRESWRRFGFGRRALLLDHGVSPLRRRLREWRRRSPPPPLAILDPEFARRVGFGTPEPEVSSLRLPTSRESHRGGIETPGYQIVLETADKAASAFGIEARYPFFDSRLLAFSVSVPAEQKRRLGWPRSIMRRAMEGVLPAAVQWRAMKQDLTPNFVRGLLGSGRGVLDRSRKLPVSIAGYVDANSVAAAFERFLGGTSGKRVNNDSRIVYRVCALTEWLDQEPDGLLRQEPVLPQSGP
jgi:asparagine synthase (glutamine-hydrolysing)